MGFIRFLTSIGGQKTVGEDNPLPANTAGTLPILASPVGAAVTTAHSPTTYAGTFEDSLDVHAGLGHLSAGGWIANDGPGNLRVGFSADGSVTGVTTDGTISTVIVVAAGEVLDLPAGIHTMKIDADQNATSYRYEVV